MTGILPSYFSKEEEKPFSPYKVKIAFYLSFYVMGKLFSLYMVAIPPSYASKEEEKPSSLYEVGIAFYPSFFVAPSCYFPSFRNDSM